jgi:3-hydroxyacyl-[acyl-carrier-protein] dehydratase
MTDDANGALDINGIMRYLPHRYPFLLVDRVLVCEPGKMIRAQKNVTINEPFFQGHFPGFPVMPGVMVIEALAQAAAILAYRSTGTGAGSDALFFFAGIDNARFRRQVLPGDQLSLEVGVIRIARGLGKFTARALVGEEVAAEAELMAALRYPSPAAPAAGNP